jgi:hypothetical protein
MWWARKPIWKLWIHNCNLQYLKSEINTLYVVLLIVALVQFRMDKFLIREKKWSEFKQNAQKLHKILLPDLQNQTNH